MNSDKELLVKEWFSKADDDEKSAAILLREKGPHHTVCFLCQQMAEKYLKAYLVAKQKSFPRIHQLVPLLDLCAKHDSSFADLKQDAAYLSHQDKITSHFSSHPHPPMTFSQSRNTHRNLATPRVSLNRKRHIRARLERKIREVILSWRLSEYYLEMRYPADVPEYTGKKQPRHSLPQRGSEILLGNAYRWLFSRIKISLVHVRSTEGYVKICLSHAVCYTVV